MIFFIWGLILLESTFVTLIVGLILSLFWMSLMFPQEDIVVGFTLGFTTYGWVFSVLVVFVSLFSFLSWNSGNLMFYRISAMLILILFTVFCTKNFLFFYAFFEFSLIPISLMMLLWGYQPERVGAFFYMIFYTVFASMPLLGLLIISHGKSVTSFSELGFYSSSIDGVFMFTEIFLIAGFMVKLPAYGVHLWLPKAHVESPIIGSMMLAGILLKLGSYGILLALPLVSSGVILSSVMGLSAIGALNISLLCLRQCDMKVLIAYSSVAHMAVGLMSAVSKTGMGILGMVAVSLSHGIISPLMFLGSYSVYERSHSRSFLLSNGMLMSNPMLMGYWFLICVASMGTPPFWSFFSEILSGMAVYSWCSLTFVLLSGVLFLGVGYSVLLYSLVSHAGAEWTKKKTGEATTTVKEHLMFSFPLVWVLSGFFSLYLLYFCKAIVNYYKVIICLPLYLFTLFLGLSSSSFLGLWVMIELSMVMILPMMGLLETDKVLVKYFLIQAFSSAFFLFLGLSSSLFMKEGLIVVVLLIKLGSSPFHWWFVSLLSFVKQATFLLLSVFQKILPIVFLSSFVLKISAKLWVLMLIIPLLELFSIRNIMGILAISSVLNMVWMLLSSLSMLILLVFMFIYYVSLSLIFFNSVLPLASVSGGLMGGLSRSVGFLSLAGIPPTLGFLSKLVVLVWVVGDWGSKIFILSLLLSSVGLLFKYLEVTMLSILMSDKGISWGLNVKPPLFAVLILFVSSGFPLLMFF